ncbi:nuclease-related domain-containing protein [Metabacillus herbersteinensis]|uniref:Nuclease-related domain-containing protein n=1 Tax=Metabacillus herbersteinensis TaxID=283816 RepID=A0ABV6GAX9_9BACI
MSLKTQKVPIYIRKLESLLRRLPKIHRKRGESHGRSLAGFNGEKSLDYHLSFLDDKKYTINNNLRLKGNKEYFYQLDLLIISPYYFLIIEVKNISGTVFFNANTNQFVRISSDKETGMLNPITQVERQKRQLSKHLKEHRLTHLPIETIVVISNQYTVIKTSSNHINISNSVIHSDDILNHLGKLGKRYSEEKITSKEIRKTSRILTKLNTPYNPDILQKFQISESELLKGDQCPRCQYIPMNRKTSKWTCSACSFTSKDAHHDAIKDYSLLVSSTITNQELRNFFSCPQLQ